MFHKILALKNSGIMDIKMERNLVVRDNKADWNSIV